MTLVPAVIILVARGADRRSRADGLHVPLRDAIWGGVGTWIAILLLAHASAIGGDTTISRPGSGLQVANRTVGARRQWGRRRGRDAAARVASACTPDRAPRRCLPLMSGSDAQGRALRGSCACVGRLGRRVARSGSASSCSPSVRSLRSAASSMRSSSTTLKRLLRAALDRERRPSSCWASAPASCSAARGADMWGGLRACRRPAALPESRCLQGVALSRRRRLRARGPGALEIDRLGGLPSADALGRRRPSSSEPWQSQACPPLKRFRVRVAHLASAPPRVAVRPHR